MIFYSYKGILTWLPYQINECKKEVLIKVAGAIKSSCRRIWDLPARYGGEEFVVLIPESDVDSASIFCEYIRQNINFLHIPHETHENRDYITCSYGICSQRPKEGGHWEDLFRKADEALHEAKKAGRDCIKVR